MIAEFGVLCLVMALLAAAISFCSLRTGNGYIARILPASAWLQALCAVLALVSLILLRMESDFSVANVVAHSNLTLPLLYKITGAWGNHEGSMLLWLVFLTGYGCVFALRPVQDKELAQRALAVHGGLVAASCGFILLTSNPFARIFPPPMDGQALNPVLQDIGLVIHPPLLYLGYVGFSLVFSLAVAALLTGRAGPDWAAMARPWISFAWASLTAGIGLGSWWAYRELGWGGWWFWDPVENASLLPWLTGVALLHSNITLQKRGLLGGWVILLAIITFAMSMIGTFLVRSGALVSVHSFASDPARGMYILFFILVSVGGALLLFALRGGRLQSAQGMALASREGMMLVNNLFLVAACATLLLGTIYPLAAQWMGEQSFTVGAPYFNATLLPLMAVPLLLAALAPFMSWHHATRLQYRQAAQPALVAVLAAWFLVLAYARADYVYAALGFGLSAWLATASVRLLIQKRNRVILPVALAHLGMALLVAGITGEGLYKNQAEGWLGKSESLKLGHYTLTLEQSDIIEEPNYKAVRAAFSLKHYTKQISTLHPEFRIYPISKSTTSEAAIYRHGVSDVYAVIGESSADGKRISVRLYHVPMIYFIWLGFAFMVLGGIISVVQTIKGSQRGTT